MVILKILYHIRTILITFCFKVLYGKRFCVGKKTSFRKGFSVVIDGGKIKIGDNCFFNHYCTLASMESITIGDGTIFGENVKVYDHNHYYANYNSPIKEQGYNLSAIKIGSHCWIANNVVILKGVTIGDNSVVGAGCIIHKDVPANTVVFCNQQLVEKPIRND